MQLNRRIWTAAALVAGLLGIAPAPATRAADATAEAIAGKMGGVVDELGRKQTGTPVQGEQKEVLGDLDALIASLEKECQNCKGGMKKIGGKGAADSMIARGTGAMGALVAPGEGGKDWAQLSERERDRILQSMSEGFPPEYRTVLERYYRRLADEKGAKNSKAPAASASAATPTPAAGR